MIDALVTGALIRDPSLKTKPSGKPFCNFLLSVAVGDESPVIVSGIAFQDAAERIGTLKKGDALAVVGSLKPSQWQDKATGEERHGLNITVQSCLSPHDIQRRRKPQDDGQKQPENNRATNGKATQRNSQNAGYSSQKPAYTGFDDPVDF